MFLLGMSLLTDGLESAAGDALRSLLRRYTRTPLSAFLTGVVVTGIVQSSTAVSVATIGFVGAGLLPLAGAFGVLCGANVGTTLTAWVVAGLGLKLRIAAVALPLIALGALVKLLRRGRVGALGTALAGFGLIFVGLDGLQSGMGTLNTRLDLAQFAGDGMGARLLLVGVGCVMSIVLQSSTVAVATTLTAVHTGTLTIEQAGALVIGQNVGTSATGILAALGANVTARRAAASHVLFNVGAAVLMFAAFPLCMWLVLRVFGRHNPALAVSGMHTLFNLVGAVVFLPMTRQVVALLVRLFPRQGRTLTSSLPQGQPSAPGVAVEAAQKTARAIAADTLRALATRLHDNGVRPPHTLDELRDALDTTRAYLAEFRSDPATSRTYAAHVATLHALDHLHALIEALEPAHYAGVIAASDTVRPMAHALAVRLDDTAAWIASGADHGGPPLEAAATEMAARRKALRVEILAATARGEQSPERGNAELETVAWIDRIAQRAARVQYHLTAAATRPEEKPVQRNSIVPEAL